MEPTQVDNYFEQGLLYFTDGAYEPAIEMFTRALRLGLGDLEVMLIYRGSSYAYLGQQESALSDFNEALQRNPYLVDAYNERGCLLRLRGDYLKAIADFDTALRIDAHYYEAHYNRALTYEAMGEYHIAESDLTETVNLNPGIAAAYEARGRIRALLRDYDGAINDLERYLRMGGGRKFDDHSEIQSFIINLRINRFLSRFLPARLLPGNRI